MIASEVFQNKASVYLGDTANTAEGCVVFSSVGWLPQPVQGVDQSEIASMWRVSAPHGIEPLRVPASHLVISRLRSSTFHHDETPHAEAERVRVLRINSREQLARLHQSHSHKRDRHHRCSLEVEMRATSSTTLVRTVHMHQSVQTSP